MKRPMNQLRMLGSQGFCAFEVILLIWWEKPKFKDMSTPIKWQIHVLTNWILFALNTPEILNKLTLNLMSKNVKSYNL